MPTETILQRDRLSPASCGLREMDTTAKGFTRRRRGRGFSYHDTQGGLLCGAHRERCADLAIPPAWDDVWISPDADGHILAFGQDGAGHRQYIYHPEFRAACELAKYADLPLFAKRLPRLRRRLRRLLAGTAEEGDRVTAAVVRILDLGALRVGSQRFRRENGAFGVTTLRARHISIRGDTLSFHFRGKGGRERDVEIHSAPVADVVEELLAEELENEAGEALFRDDAHRVSARRVNAMIADLMQAPFTAKDFRTWAGSVAAAAYLRRADEPTITGAADAASERLGNTSAIARSSYIHPALIEAARDRRRLTRKAGPTRLRVDERVCYAAIGDS